MSDRFCVRKEGLTFRLRDGKTQEFLNVFADYDTLTEVARLLNNLDQKNKCLMKKAEVLSKFADPVEVNRYWEMINNE